MRRRARAFVLAFIAAVPVFAGTADAQTGPVCVACRSAYGIRFNYRDRDMERVAGANITIWTPYHPISGSVNGFAIGLPATGAREIAGFAIAPAGFGVSEHFEGIGIAGLGLGVGGTARGILLSGLGAGIGAGGFAGIAVAGLGTGVGGDATGVIISGLGGGVAGKMRGIGIAGLGFGGGAIEGLAIAGLGAGVAGSMRGIIFAGLGVGAGEAISGVTVVGLGAGAGERIGGLAIAGLGLGSPRIEGIAIAPVVKTQHARALVISPAFFQAKRLDGDALAQGLFVATVNDVRGLQRGVSIGIVNYARSLRGVQIGAINIVADGRGPRIMPLINWR